MTVKEIKGNYQEAARGTRPSFSASIPIMTNQKTTRNATGDKSQGISIICTVKMAGLEIISLG